MTNFSMMDLQFTRLDLGTAADVIAMETSQKSEVEIDKNTTLHITKNVHGQESAMLEFRDIAAYLGVSIRSKTSTIN